MITEKGGRRPAPANQRGQNGGWRSVAANRQNVHKSDVMTAGNGVVKCTYFNSLIAFCLRIPTEFNSSIYSMIFLLILDIYLSLLTTVLIV